MDYGGDDSPLLPPYTWVFSGSEAAFLTAAMAAGRRDALPQPAPQKGGAASSDGLQVSYCPGYYVLGIRFLTDPV